MGFAPPSSRSGEAGSVAALRETLRIAEAEHSSERREASRRLSQQAQRFATTDEGLRIERVQIAADVRVRRILNALRVKDESRAEQALTLAFALASGLGIASLIERNHRQQAIEV